MVNWGMPQTEDLCLVVLWCRVCESNTHIGRAEVYTLFKVRQELLKSVTRVSNLVCPPLIRCCRAALVYHRVPRRVTTKILASRVV